MGKQFFLDVFFYKMRHHGHSLGPCRLANLKALIILESILVLPFAIKLVSFLQVFIQFARGRPPQTIVTDLDSGIRDAIAMEMPNTKHIISLWQVLSKLSSWFSFPLGLQFPEFKSEFDVLCHLESVEDFEHQWNHLVAQFGLGSDKHIALLFSYRTSWPVCYTRSFFLAHALTPEYLKSVETFMKNILNTQSCLQSFFEQVDFLCIFKLHNLFHANLVNPNFCC